MDAQAENGLDGVTASLRCLGFGFWQAWSLILYSGTFLEIDESSAIESILSSHAYTSALITFSLGGIILALMVLPLFKQTDRWLPSTWFPVLGCILATAATLALGLMMPSASVPSALFCAISFAAGVGNGLLCLTYAPMLGMIPPQKSFPLTCLSMILSCVLFFVALTMPFDLKCAFIAALPAAAGLIPVIGRADDKQLLDDITQRLALDKHTGRLFIAMLIMGCAVSFIHDPLFMQTSSLKSELVWNGLGVFIALLLCADIALYYGLRRQSPPASMLYYPLGVFIIVFAVFAFISGISDDIFFTSFLNELSTVPRLLLDVALDAILFYAIYQSKASPAKIMGFGLGLKSVGTLLGTEFGLAFSSAVTASIAICLIAVVCVVVALVFVAPSRVLADVLISIDDQDAKPSPEQLELMPESAETPTAADAESGDAPAGSSSASEKLERARRIWNRRCELVSERCMLSPRESEVLYLLSLGHGSEFISNELSISLHTARTHTRNIYYKVCVHSREELIRLVEEITVEEE